MTTVPKRTSLGDRGDAVRAWQQFLLSQGYAIGTADGHHGPKTEAASRDYESKAATVPAPSSPYPIAVTSDQKRAIDSVLSIFETGKLPSPESYSTCTVLADGAGISYGKHQSTDRAGSLDLVCKRYVELGGARSSELGAYLGYLSSNESSKVNPKGPYPDWLRALMALLRDLGREPLMQRCQDEVFDRVYFEPAVKHCQDLGLTKALSLLTIYDTCIHSGPGRVASHRKAIACDPPLTGGDEATWLKAYVAERRAWLLRSSNELVRKTIYRPDAISKLIAAGNWDLKMPFACCGRQVS